MSNYTKTTNFATKDSLASGNPNKIVKGTEINSEFDNIAVAVATKANTASPSLTGTVTAAALNVTGNLDVDGTLEFDSISGTGSVAVTDIADEDNMSSDSATKLATQQSIKAYVDSQVTAQDLDLTDGTTSISIDLDSEALSVLGSTGVTSTASGNSVTLAIDSTVATLTGSQTLTNKTLTSPDVNTPDIDGGTIDGTVIGGATAAAGSFTTVGATGNITVGGTVDGRDLATDGSKLDGIEASADVTDTTNVTAAGALMDSELTAIASVKALNQGVATGDSPTFAALTSTGEITANGGIALGDSDIATFGAGDDLSIYHDGSNSYIREFGAGDLKIQAINVQIENSSGTKMFRGVSSGEAILYHNNSAKLATTATGIDVTGTATMDGLVVNAGTPNVAATFTSSDDTVSLVLTDNDTTNKIHSSGTGLRFEINGSETGRFDSAGLDVIGTATMDGLTVDAGRISIDGGTDRTINITNGSGADRFTINNDGVTSGHTLITQAVSYLSFVMGTAEALRIDNGGDISFYEDTGTTAKMVWKASDESLGIGTSAPQAGIHITQDNTQLILAGAASTNDKFMAFDVDLDADTDTQFITVDQADDLAFGEKLNDNDRVIENEWMRITNAGKVGIGTSSPTSALTTNVTADGAIHTFSVSDVAVGRIGSFAGVVSYIALDPRTSGVNGSGLMGGSVSQTEGTIQPTNGAGAKDDAAINLGVSTNRFKDLYLSGGVYLGGTGAANKLDDYEEGTWTPELRFGGATPSGIVQTSSLGYYTKVGNLVTVQVKIILSSKGAQTGNAEIYGLPFSAGANGDAGAYPSYFNNLNLTASQVPIGKSSGGAMELRYSINGVANRMTNGHIEDTTDIRMFSSYYV